MTGPVPEILSSTDPLLLLEFCFPSGNFSGFSFKTMPCVFYSSVEKAEGFLEDTAGL